MDTIDTHKRRIAKQLEPAVDSARFAAFWRKIESRGWLDQLESWDEEDWEQLAQDVTTPGELIRLFLSRDRGPNEEVVAALSPTEAARASALDRYWARRAGREEIVSRFRGEVLGGRLLPAAAAVAFLSSPVLERLSARECAELDIPVVGHVAQRESGGGHPDYAITVTITPPGTTRTIGPHSIANPKVFTYPGMDRKPAVAWESSVLARLYRIGEILGEIYGWRDAGTAAFFVLTGDPPARAPLTVGTEFDPVGGEVVILRVAPWVSAGTLTATYTQVQRSIFTAAPGRTRPSNLAVFMFVTEHSASGDPRDDEWPSLLKGWNRARPDAWPAYAGVRRFKRDYYRARDSLLDLPYRDADSEKYEKQFRDVYRDWLLGEHEGGDRG